MTLTISIVIRFIRHLPFSGLPYAAFLLILMIWQLPTSHIEKDWMKKASYPHISGSLSNFLFQFLIFGFVYV